MIGRIVCEVSVYILVIVYTRFVMAKRTKMISIRLLPRDYKFLKKKNISPTRALDEAIINLRKCKKW
jgi:hypothetical protein